MFTRCPQCTTVHPLTARVLSHKHGTLRCGRCGKKFNALNFLFDQRPSGKSVSASSNLDVSPPVIGALSKPAIKKDKTRVDLNPNRLRWNLLAAALLVVTIINVGWTFREPLMRNPIVSEWFQVEQEGMSKDPSQIQLVSRDMHSHPTRSGILVLSLTFVNLAPYPQIFPTLEITLLDGSNQPVARRRFVPADYLRPGANTQLGLATDVLLPVLLELADPGEQVVGFEIQFL